jgi:hypothetical protein
MNTDRIVAILTQLRRLLVKHHIDYFVVDIERLLKESHLPYQIFQDKVAAEFFRYGGMGSPTDLYISKDNGNRVDREEEANYEVQALFDVLYREVKPAEDPDGPIKHFWTYPSTHAEWEVKLTSGNLEAIFDILIQITYHHADWVWVQDWCLYFTQHSNLDVRALAIRCLADLARLHKALDSGRVLTRLGELMNDPAAEVREQAEKSLRDIAAILDVVS